MQLPEFRIGKSGIGAATTRRLRAAPAISKAMVNAIGREIRELDRREGDPGGDVPPHPRHGAAPLLL